MWFRVDDKLWGSPKWLAIKAGARALWVTAGAWSMDQLTDGKVPAHVVPILGGRPSDAKALVTCGLWNETDGGYQFHDWHDWQPTRESIITKRENEAQRKAAWREKRSQKQQESAENDAMSQRDTDGTTASVPQVSHDGPTLVPDLSRSSRPDPTRPDPTAPKGAESARKRATSLPADWKPTPEHVERAAQDGIDLEREVIKFRAWADEGNTSKSWNGRFTRWLMQAAEYAAERPRPATQPSSATVRALWGDA